MHQFTNPYTPEQNGVSERYNRTIMEAARAMLYHAKLPLSFWAEAVSTACYVRNRSPTAALAGKTPYEVWYGEKPNLSNLRVFGCLAYVHIPDSRRRKLDPKSEKCIFVGYPEGTKGFKLYSLQSDRFIRSASVYFCENDFHQWIHHSKKQYAEFFLDDSEQSTGELPDVVAVEQNDGAVGGADTGIHSTYEDKFLSNVHALPEKRVRAQPARFEGQFAYEYCMTSLVLEEDEPKSFDEAVCNDNWNAAMQSEFDSLLENETWELVPRPNNVNVVGCRWVYKVKRDANGNIARYKARLVAQGYSQIEGIDYGEVFAPVTRYSTVRTLLAFANENDYEIHQMDVKSAYLHAPLECDVYVKQPEEYEEYGKDGKLLVWKLMRSLYGLKQSGRNWRGCLSDVLKQACFIQSKVDTCVYFKHLSNGTVIIIVWVDDLILVASSLLLMDEVKMSLKNISL